MAIKAHKRPSGYGSVLTLCRAASLSTIFVEQLSSYCSASYILGLLHACLLSSTAAGKTSTAAKVWGFFHANNEDKVRLLSSFL